MLVWTTLKICREFKDQETRSQKIQELEITRFKTAGQTQKQNRSGRAGSQSRPRRTRPRRRRSRRTEREKSHRQRQEHTHRQNNRSKDHCNLGDAQDASES